MTTSACDDCSDPDIELEARAARSVDFCHCQVLPQCAAVVTHACHGTVIRSLAFGVPVICIPIRRDQTANAARVVYHGAGVRLSKKGGAKKIAGAIREVVGNPDYQRKAKELSINIVEQSKWQKLCEKLEQSISGTISLLLKKHSSTLFLRRFRCVKSL